MAHSRVENKKPQCDKAAEVQRKLKSSREKTARSCKSVKVSN